MKRCLFLLLLLCFLCACTPTSQTGQVVLPEELQAPAYDPVDTTAQADPNAVPLSPRFNGLYAYGGVRYIVDTEGNLVAWGLGEDEHSLSAPTGGDVAFDDRIVLLENIKEVKGCYSWTMALDADGNLYSWNNSPISLLLERVKAFDVGFDFGAAILEDNSLWLWGDDMYGQQGLGMPETEDYYPPHKCLDDVQTVRCNGFGVFAVTCGGDLYYWGNFRGTPQKIATNVRDCQEGLLLTTDGELFTYGFPQPEAYPPAPEDEVVFLTEPTGLTAERLVSGGFITESGGLFLWQDNNAHHVAHNVVDACPGGEAGTYLYLTADGLLYMFDETTWSDVWRYRLDEI